MERKIYLDNASTTYVSNEVLNEMMPVSIQFMEMLAQYIVLEEMQCLLLTVLETELKML